MRKTQRKFADQLSESVQQPTEFKSINHMRKTDDPMQLSLNSVCRLFEFSPIATLEADYSEIKKSIDILKKKGVSDFRKYFEKYPDEVLSLAGKVNILRANKAALELFGADSKEELLKNIQFVFNKESYDVFKEELINLSEGATEFCSEAISQTLSRKEQDVLLRVLVPPECENNLSNLFVYICDISGLKQMEKDLKESEEKYRSIVEAAYDAILVIDVETGIILEANKSAEKLLGVSSDNIVGMHFTQIHPEKEAERCLRIFKEQVKKGKLVSENLVVNHESEEEIPVSMSSSTIKLRGKKCITVLIRELTQEEARKKLVSGSYDKEFFPTIAVQSLSQRQREIMSLIALGKTNKQIAEMLYISEKTVETHRTRIMQKLDVHKTADLVRYAISSGLLKSSSPEL